MLQVSTQKEANIFVNHINDYISTLKDTCAFSNEEASFGSVSFCLYKINNLPYQANIVVEAIEKAMLASDDFSPHDITASFVEIYPDLIQPLYLEREITDLLVEENAEIAYQYSTFCSHTLPVNETDKLETITKYPHNELSISCVKGLPYGGVARLIVFYVNSMAVKYKSREIDIGSSIKQFVEKLGYTSSYKEGGINSQVISQLEKLFYTTYVHTTQSTTVMPDGTFIYEKNPKRLHLFDESITWQSVKNDLTTNAVAKVVLNEDYFKEITNHPVPLSLEAIKQLKKSPLALDLYALIAYRVNTGSLIPLPLKELQIQFGDSDDLWRFKERVLTAIKYVQKVWPELKYIVKTTKRKNGKPSATTILIPRMSPHILPKAAQIDTKAGTKLHK